MRLYHVTIQGQTYTVLAAGPVHALTTLLGNLGLTKPPSRAVVRPI